MVLLHPGEILLPFADILEQMGQVPFIGLRNLVAAWGFYFFRRRFHGSLGISAIRLHLRGADAGL